MQPVFKGMGGSAAVFVQITIRAIYEEGHMFKRTDSSFFLGEDPRQPLAEIAFIPLGEDELSITHTYVTDALRG